MIDRPDDNHYGGDDDDAEDEKVNGVMMTMNNEIIINIATGKTSQAITSFDYFHLF